MLNFSLTREAWPIQMDGLPKEGKKETYSGSGCSTGGSWGGRFWSEHLSQWSCRLTVPYTPHTEEVTPNRDSIVTKHSSTSCSFSGISLNKLVKRIKPKKNHICVCLVQSNSCSLVYFWLMILHRNHLLDNDGSCLRILEIPQLM